MRTARFPDSIAKLLGLLAACDQIGVLFSDPMHLLHAFHFPCVAERTHFQLLTEVDMFPAAISQEWRVCICRSGSDGQHSPSESSRAAEQDVYVVPLHSWYNAEFDKKSRSKLRQQGLFRWLHATQQR